MENTVMKRVVIIIVGLMAAFVTVVNAQESVRIKHLNVSGDKLALSGYDPVAYIKHGTAAKGKVNLTASHNGVTYRFSTEVNQKEFLSSPASYVPQYGGWCAYAMGAKGEKVEVDPETFKIIDGKLYLFYNRFFTNTLESWNEDEAKLKLSADKNWTKIISPTP